MDVPHYIKVTDNIHTSGQPQQEDFNAIANAGIKTIINLAMPDSDKAITEEGAIVTALGMNYIHIPVVWTSPQEEQFNLFRKILNAQADDKILVHCMLNWRVSSFIYLYKVLELNIDQENAQEALLKVWEPDKNWQAFIDSIMTKND